jgi:hypothetical protein
VFAAIPDPTLEPEGIAYDAAERRFFLGSMKGAIWQVDASGRASPFVREDPTLLPVLGIKVDASRKLLWAVNTIYPDFPPAPTPKPGVGLTALNVYELATGKLLKRHVLDERPTVHAFNDVVVAKSGDAYTTNSSANAVFRVDAGGKLAPLLSDGTMTMPNGLALSANERILYVAHIEGISAIDLASRKRSLLAVSRTMAVGSIDGLAATERSLIGIQTSPYLQRTIRMDLDATGLAVEKITVLDARSHPRLAQTTGVIVGDAFFTIAHPGAAPADRKPEDLPTILRIPL